LLARRWARRPGLETPSGNAAVSARVRIRGHDAVLSRSTTYMNHSGRAAVALRDHHGVDAAELLVVYDDADLEIGRIRIRERGGAGGHNGMHSLITALDSEEIPRVRLGVLGRDRDSSDLAEYVLREFHPEETEAAHALVEMGADAVETVVSQGVAIAMNRFNGRSALDGADDNA